jgi:hypothetical protein
MSAHNISESGVTAGEWRARQRRRAAPAPFYWTDRTRVNYLTVYICFVGGEYFLRALSIGSCIYETVYLHRTWHFNKVFFI